MLNSIWTAAVAVVLLLAAPALALSGTVVLPQTGQTTCYDSTGAVIPCVDTGQDGDTKSGAPWPAPRLKDHGDGTITDELTGLMILKDGNCFPFQDWETALKTVQDFNNNPGNFACKDYTANYNDWYLPNIVELESLLNAQYADSATWLNTQGFVDMKGFPYWSSTTDTLFPEEAKTVDMSIGNVYRQDKQNTHVWVPVRNGIKASPDPTYPANLWRTGQVKCFDESGTVIPCAGTGQDADNQAGVPWPNPRFVDNSDGTVTDMISGNTWLKDANCMKTKYPAYDDDGGNKNEGDVFMDHALSFVAGINDGTYSDCGAGKNDWRVPNRKDFFSLLDSSQNDPVLPPNHPFENLPQSAYYWTSTTRASSPANAFRFSIEEGFLDADNKISAENYVWPVRGGDPVYNIYLPIIIK